MSANLLGMVCVSPCRSHLLAGVMHVPRQVPGHRLAQNRDEPQRRQLDVRLEGFLDAVPHVLLVQHGRAVEEPFLRVVAAFTQRKVRRRVELFAFFVLPVAVEKMRFLVDPFEQQRVPNHEFEQARRSSLLRPDDEDRRQGTLRLQPPRMVLRRCQVPRYVAAAMDVPPHRRGHEEPPPHRKCVESGMFGQNSDSMRLAD